MNSMPKWSSWSWMMPGQNLKTKDLSRFFNRRSLARERISKNVLAAKLNLWVLLVWPPLGLRKGAEKESPSKFLHTQKLHTQRARVRVCVIGHWMGSHSVDDTLGPLLTWKLVPRMWEVPGHVRWGGYTDCITFGCWWGHNYYLSF